LKLPNFLDAVLPALSPPARGRGLKLDHSHAAKIGPLSPPARGRGLKRQLLLDAVKRIGVAPRTGAWIETLTATQ